MKWPSIEAAGAARRSLGWLVAWWLLAVPIGAAEPAPRSPAGESPAPKARDRSPRQIESPRSLWNAEGPLAEEGDPEFQWEPEFREHGRGQTPWLALEENGSIVYLAFAVNPRVERYNLGTGSWLPTISLLEEPTAFWVDDAGMYISFGRRTSHFALDGSTETHLRNTNQDAVTLVTMASYLYINAPPQLLSADKLTGTLLDFEEYGYDMTGLSVAPSALKLFARSTNVSPSDIVQVALFADGTLGAQSNSPYHGDYPGAVQTFTLPGDAEVADDSGIVYGVDDLGYRGSLAGPFDDLAAHSSGLLVLRGASIDLHSATFLRIGSHDLTGAAQAIVVHGDEVVAFAEDPPGTITVETVEIDAIGPVPISPAVDPRGLAYEPDWVYVGADDLVYLLSSAHENVFRWSPAGGDYLESIPLRGSAAFMAYSAVNDSLYLAYDSGEITQVDLTGSGLGGGLEETPFANSPQMPCGLATAGEYVFACDPSGAWVSHFTYGPGGNLISQEEWNYPSQEFVWSPVLRKMYHTRDASSPNDVYWEDIDIDGVLGDQMDSPFHGGMGQLHPIRVKENGAYVVLGSGWLLDAITLDQFDTLSNNIDDGVWVGDLLYTMRSFNGNTQLQRWDEALNWAVTATADVPGEPLRLFWFEGQALTLSLVDGKPAFSTWNADLEGTSLLVTKTDGQAEAEAGSEIVYTIGVHNPSTGVVAAFVEDLFPEDLENARWVCTPTPGSGCAVGAQVGDIEDFASIQPLGTVTYTATTRLAFDATEPVVNSVTATSPLGTAVASDRTDIDADGTTVIFYDGFESGDTSAWSLTVGR